MESHRNQTDLSKYNNSFFNPGKNLFIRTLWYFVNAIFFINPLNPSSGLKIVLLRLFGARIGKGVVIKPAVNIKYPWKLKIGDYSWIGEKVWIDNLDNVIIGDNCCISQGAMLLTGNHDFAKSTFDLKTGPIILENGVWISARSILTMNTKCFSHSVLLAGSVLRTNMEAYSVYSGNPAIKVKNRKIE
ncbi:MAG: WcaF family extracellular polysaccharide biosynthesis acetyltransferase [Bacteroidales bacterium]